MLKLNRYVYSILTFVLYFLGIQLLPGIALVMSPKFGYWWYALIQVVTMLLIFWMYFDALIRSFKKLRFGSIFEIIKMQFVLYASLMAASVLVLLLGFEPVESENQEFIASIIGDIPIWFAILQLSVVAPFTEEMTFRYVIITPVRGKLFRVFAIVFSCMVFALLHVIVEIGNGDFSQVLLSAVPYVVMSSILTYNFIKKEDNIASNILVHSLNNSIALLFLI